MAISEFVDPVSLTRPVKGGYSARDEIVQFFTDAIRDGKLKPGQRLVSQSDMANSFKVSPVTMSQAVKVLVERGLLTTGYGSGTRVAGGD